MGSRLRLVLHQPDGGLVVAASEADGLQEVELVAFASHGRLSGRIRLDRARLSDMLNEHDEFQLEDVLAMHLPEGRTRVMHEMVIRRSELHLVHAGGPRGDRARRARTVPQGIIVKCGPYLVSGDVHSAPGIDPLDSFGHRQAMVPLTDAIVDYPGPHGRVQEAGEVVVVNRYLADWVRRSEGIAAPDMGRALLDRAGS